MHKTIYAASLFPTICWPVSVTPRYGPANPHRAVSATRRAGEVQAWNCRLKENQVGSVFSPKDIK